LNMTGKLLAYHLKSPRVPLVVRVPQFENHCTNGSFEICQERMFVKQHRKNGWSIYLLPKKYLCCEGKKPSQAHKLRPACYYKCDCICLRRDPVTTCWGSLKRADWITLWKALETSWKHNPCWTAIVFSNNSVNTFQ